MVRKGIEVIMHNLSSDNNLTINVHETMNSKKLFWLKIIVDFVYSSIILQNCLTTFGFPNDLRPVNIKLKSLAKHRK